MSSSILARLRADERGAGLMAEVGVGVLAQAMSISASVALMVSSLGMYTVVQGRASVAEQVMAAESGLRSDLRWATHIEAVSPTEFSAVVPGQDGSCREVTWQVRDAPEESFGQLVSTSTTYESVDASAVPVVCAGESSSALTEVVVHKLTAGTQFTYLTTAGRQISADGSELGPQVVGVASPAQESRMVAGVQTRIESHSRIEAMSTPVVVRQTSQVIDAITEVPGDWQTVFVGHERLSPSAQVKL